MKISLNSVDRNNAAFHSISAACDDIRQLQAEQEFCGMIGWYGLRSPKPLGNPSAGVRTHISPDGVPQSSGPKGFRPDDIMSVVVLAAELTGDKVH
jgi:hypothetical protein